MNDLLVISFPSEGKAAQVRGKLLSMEKEALIKMEDAVVAVKSADGTIKLNQLMSSSEFWDIRAAASGYPAPIPAGALTDFGSNEEFVKEIGNAIPPGGTAVFVLVSKMTANKVLKSLNDVGAKILLTHFERSEAEAIRAALAAQA
jgi:uncharacterized membrane protein